MIIAYNSASSVPFVFYLRDINKVHKTLNLTQLNTYNTGIVELHRLCDINYDTHEEAINALGTVNAVEAYDFETGWPTIPFTPS